MDRYTNEAQRHHDQEPEPVAKGHKGEIDTARTIVFDPFEATIKRVAEACRVPAWWVWIEYQRSRPSDEIDGTMPWTIQVTVINPRARKFDQATVREYGETVERAADAVIASVSRAYAEGRYKAP